MTGLRTDLGTKGLDALWITHQHSDHVGGAEDVLTTFKTALYVDNGLDLTATAVVRSARAAVSSTGAELHVVDPTHPTSPITGTSALKFTPIVPSSWPSSCLSDQNACSIALRVDYCKSSVLFLGDTPILEEGIDDPRGAVTLLQVGHHGSVTSTGSAFLERVKPKYAVISAGKPDEGTNQTYCHPSSMTVQDLTAALGGPGAKTMRAYDASAVCKSGSTAWLDVPANDRLWLTARDGDIALTTIGDGTFTRE
jgi:competence protein ComEC